MNNIKQSDHGNGVERSQSAPSASTTLRKEVPDETEESSTLMQGAKERVAAFGVEQANATTDRAAESVESVGSALHTFADSLRDEEQETLAGYAARMAESVNGLADELRNRSVDTMISDVNRLARRNPGAFLAGSVAAGFVLSRFLRASSHRTETAARPTSSAADSGTNSDAPGHHG